MNRELSCLRCNGLMQYIKNERLQLGEKGWILGDIPNLLAGSLEVAIYVCPSCGKIEFFQAEDVSEGDSLEQVECPGCGKMHDFDYPKCPFCKYDYYRK